MLTLIVPGLIWTRQALADLTHDLPLPAFSTLLGRGRLAHSPPQTTSHALAHIVGLSTPLPAAALRWLALREHPGDAEWLCLDPVRLRFEQRTLIVDDATKLELTDEESRSLAASLAPTFSALGELEVVTPRLWNLRLSGPAPAFQALPDASGRTAAALPLEAAYAPWRQAINDAQILLHSHPVNQAREGRGQPVVNSIWPWGSGRLPQPRACAHDALWSGDPIIQGIARLLKLDTTASPKAYAATTARAALAVIDTMDVPARSGDALVWRDELARFESDWLTPALGALQAGRLDSLHLIAPGDSGSAELLVSRHDLWKFWRKPRAMAELAPP